MPKFAANLSMLFTEHPFLDRFSAAAAAGFTAVECQFPYDHTPQELSECLNSTGLELILLNIPAGDLAAGERGLAIFPDRQAECREQIDYGLDYAVRLGCPRMHLLSGLVPAGLEYEVALSTYIDNIRYAVRRAGQSGPKILVEPFNSVDVPNYLVHTVEDARHIIELARCEGVGLQFDFYHTQMEQGDLASTFQRHFELVSHVQISGVPGRHEPDDNEINYTYLFGLIDALGYEGYVGCEYNPRGSTVEGLNWLDEHLGR
tara:strand:+ start:44 stop:826 length:783 start_codon:yes stop_codon:yes gene_type:complete